MKVFVVSKGFTLVELMVSLAIGTVISVAVVQVMVSNRVTNEFNQTVGEVQESGRYVLTRIKNELLETGLYDSLYRPVVPGVDITSEEAFVRNHPVVLANHMAAMPALATVNGAGTANDELVISLQAQIDCTGAGYGGAAGETQHIINHYFVADSELRCTGFNGRALRGVVADNASNGTVVLMDQVESFQIQYGITASAGATTGGAIQYVTADQLAAAEDNSQMVVAIRIGVLIQSTSGMASIENREYTVLDVTGLNVEPNRYGQVFTHTVSLRNMKNFARSI